MAKSQGHLLSRVGDLPGLGQSRFELLEYVLLPTLPQRGFELERAIEMIVDGALSPARDKEELLDAGCLGLFDRVMNKRRVDDWQHLLGHRLGRRQKAGSQPGDGEDGFADRSVHEFLVASLGQAI